MLFPLALPPKGILAPVLFLATPEGASVILLRAPGASGPFPTPPPIRDLSPTVFQLSYNKGVVIMRF